MKRKTYIACFTAAVAALSLSTSYKASADILQWDASGNSAPTYTDGPGTWGYFDGGMGGSDNRYRCCLVEHFPGELGGVWRSLADGDCEWFSNRVGS